MLRHQAIDEKVRFRLDALELDRFDDRFAKVGITEDSVGASVANSEMPDGAGDRVVPRSRRIRLRPVMAVR